MKLTAGMRATKVFLPRNIKDDEVRNRPACVLHRFAGFFPIPVWSARFLDDKQKLGPSVPTCCHVFLKHLTVREANRYQG